MHQALCIVWFLAGVLSDPPLILQALIELLQVHAAIFAASKAAYV